MEVYNFVRDRSRSIRQDFTYQGVLDATYVEIHEEIARFRIACISRYGLHFRYSIWSQTD